MTHPLTGPDMHIAELLTGGVSMQRILAIGRFRRSWGPQDVARVHAWMQERDARSKAELAQIAELRPVVPSVARCGTEAGAKRHYRKHEKVCTACRIAANDARRKREAS